MHPYLEKLGIRKEVQLFFEPYYHHDEAGNLAFCYGSETEHFGFAWHRVPRAVHWWQAGDDKSARQLFICASAMEAICFLSLNFHRYPVPEQLLFIAPGSCFAPDQLQLLRALYGRKKTGLVMGRDILGRLQDIHLATDISGKAVKLKYAGKEIFELTYRNHRYAFHEAGLTLNLFEKAAGLRCGIRTYKAKGADTFLGQLMKPFNKY